MQGRPKSIVVFAVINIILGMLGVLGAASALVVRLGLIPMPPNDPYMAAMSNNAAYAWFIDISSVIGFVATIVLLSAGIALLQLQPWARMAAIGWSVYTMVIIVLSAVMNYVLLFMPLLDKAQGPERVGLMIGIGFSIFFSLLFVFYAALQIWFLTRPKIMQAFAASQQYQTL
jgi:hypothetical protein